MLITKREWLWVIFGTLIIIISAKMSMEVPMNGAKIPITGQSLGVLLVAYGLKSKLGTLSVALYILLGIIGLPVFAENTSGWKIIMGNSGGYLYGFLIAAFVIGKFSEKFPNKKFYHHLTAMLLGTVIILFIGVSHLTYHIGFNNAIFYGLYPYVSGGVIKAILGALIASMFPFFRKNFPF